MQVQFSSPVVIRDDKGKKFSFAKGINEVPNELNKNWYLVSLVKEGKAKILGSAPVEAKKAAPPQIKKVAPTPPPLASVKKSKPDPKSQPASGDGEKGQASKG